MLRENGAEQKTLLHSSFKEVLLMLRVVVPLTQSELDALVRMAEGACRHPKEQARYIIREEARRLGIFSALPEDDAGSDEQNLCSRQATQYNGHGGRK